MMEVKHYPPKDLFKFFDEDILKGVLEEPRHLGRLRKAIESRNRDLFAKEVGDGVIRKKLTGQNGLLSLNRLASMLGSRPNFHTAGYHYVSLSQGVWFRFIGEEYKESGASKIEHAYYEDIYDCVPRESNLFTSSTLVKPIRIQFGGSSSNQNIPHLTEAKWKYLKENFKKANLLKCVAKSSPGAVEIKEKRIINNIQNQLSEFLKELGDSLSSCVSKNGKTQIESLKNQDLFDKWLLETFVFSFFPTIYAKIKDRSNRPLYVLVIPYRWSIVKDTSVEEEIVKYATFGGSYTTDNDCPLTDDQVAKLSRYLQILPVFILAQEFSVSWEIIDPSTLVSEDVIRQCTRVDDSEEHIVVQSRVNRWREQFQAWLSPYRNGASYPEKEILEEILYRTSGYSHKYLTLLENIRSAVEVTSKEGTLKPIFIFLHSEPGCGKENIARLSHLLSFRAGKEDILDKTLCQEIVTYGSLYDRVKRDDRIKRDLHEDDRFSIWATIKQEKTKSKAKDWKNMTPTSLAPCDKLKDKLFFNYLSYPCGKLSKENYERDVEYGLFLRAHLLLGTVFLDEFNTMPTVVADNLLRVLEKPYKIHLRTSDSLIEVKMNIMVICASNNSPEQLVEKNFNQAVIDRITQISFEIPPLRKRPEDIAVFVNYLALDYNCNVYREEQKVHSINPAALRLICELPWENNYRGVKGLMEDIFSHRRRRNLTTDSISFDEVMDSLKRRNIV